MTASSSGHHRTPAAGAAPGAEPEHSHTLRAIKARAVFGVIPEIAVEVELQPEPDERSVDFALRLIDSPTPEEAVTFAAQMFVPRAAVWWGHECLRVSAALLGPDDTVWMERAAHWVGNPSEPVREALLAQAMAESKRGPGAWLALAAGWSGGSMAPPGSPIVPPPPHLTGRGVNAAILMTLARAERASRQGFLKSYLSMARDLA